MTSESVPQQTQPEQKPGHAPLQALESLVSDTGPESAPKTTTEIPIQTTAKMPTESPVYSTTINTGTTSSVVTNGITNPTYQPSKPLVEDQKSGYLGAKIIDGILKYPIQPIQRYTPQTLQGRRVVGQRERGKPSTMTMTVPVYGQRTDCVVVASDVKAQGHPYGVPIAPKPRAMSVPVRLTGDVTPLQTCQLPFVNIGPSVSESSPSMKKVISTQPVVTVSQMPVLSTATEMRNMSVDPVTSLPPNVRPLAIAGLSTGVPSISGRLPSQSVNQQPISLEKDPVLSHTPAVKRNKEPVPQSVGHSTIVSSQQPQSQSYVTFSGNNSTSSGTWQLEISHTGPPQHPQQRSVLQQAVSATQKVLDPVTVSEVSSPVKSSLSEQKLGSSLAPVISSQPFTSRQTVSTSTNTSSEGVCATTSVGDSSIQQSSTSTSSRARSRKPSFRQHIAVTTAPATTQPNPNLSQMTYLSNIASMMTSIVSPVASVNQMPTVPFMPVTRLPGSSSCIPMTGVYRRMVDTKAQKKTAASTVISTATSKTNSTVIVTCHDPTAVISSTLPGKALLKPVRTTTRDVDVVRSLGSLSSGSMSSVVQSNHLTPVLQSGYVMSPVVQPSSLIPVSQSHVMPVSQGHVMPVSQGHVIPVSQSYMMPSLTQSGHAMSPVVQPSSLIPVSQSHVMPVSQSHVMPVSQGHVIPVSQSYMMPSLTQSGHAMSIAQTGHVMSSSLQPGHVTSATQRVVSKTVPSSIVVRHAAKSGGPLSPEETRPATVATMVGTTKPVLARKSTAGGLRTSVFSSGSVESKPAVPPKALHVTMYTQPGYGDTKTRSVETMLVSAMPQKPLASSASRPSNLVVKRLACESNTIFASPREPQAVNSLPGRLSSTYVGSSVPSLSSLTTVGRISNGSFQILKTSQSNSHPNATHLSDATRARVQSHIKSKSSEMPRQSLASLMAPSRVPSGIGKMSSVSVSASKEVSGKGPPPLIKTSGQSSGSNLVEKIQAFKPPGSHLNGQVKREADCDIIESTPKRIALSVDEPSQDIKPAVEKPPSHVSAFRVHQRSSDINRHLPSFPSHRLPVTIRSDNSLTNSHDVKDALNQASTPGSSVSHRILALSTTRETQSRPSHQWSVPVIDLTDCPSNRQSPSSQAQLKTSHHESSHRSSANPSHNNTRCSVYLPHEASHIQQHGVMSGLRHSSTQIGYQGVLSPPPPHIAIHQQQQTVLGSTERYPYEYPPQGVYIPPMVGQPHELYSHPGPRVMSQLVTPGYPVPLHSTLLPYPVVQQASTKMLTSWTVPSVITPVQESESIPVVRKPVKPLDIGQSVSEPKTLSSPQRPRLFVRESSVERKTSVFRVNGEKDDSGEELYVDSSKDAQEVHSQQVHLGNVIVLEGCISQYISLLYWRDASLIHYATVLERSVSQYIKLYFSDV